MQGEFLAHAQRVASVFWSFDLSCGGALPSSVVGQLGGPSQRRLPAIITSAVLKGVCCNRSGSPLLFCDVFFLGLSLASASRILSTCQLLVELNELLIA